MDSPTSPAVLTIPLRRGLLWLLVPIVLVVPGVAAWMLLSPEAFKSTTITCPPTAGCVARQVVAVASTVVAVVGGGALTMILLRNRSLSVDERGVSLPRPGGTRRFAAADVEAVWVKPAVPNRVTLRMGGRVIKTGIPYGQPQMLQFQIKGKRAPYPLGLFLLRLHADPQDLEGGIRRVLGLGSRS